MILIELFTASQLITFGETQVSIFNYENGDLMMSLDFMKSYGTNLTTVEFKEVRKNCFSLSNSILNKYCVLELSIYGVSR